MQVQQTRADSGQPVTRRDVPRDGAAGRLRRLHLTASSRSSCMPILSLIYHGDVSGSSSTRSSAARRRSSRCWRSSRTRRSSARSAPSLGAPIQLMPGHDDAWRGPFNLGALVPMLDEGSLSGATSSAASASSRSGASIVTAIGLARALPPEDARNIAIALFVVYCLIVAASSSRSLGRCRQVDNGMSRKKKIFIGLAHRRRARRRSAYANLGLKRDDRRRRSPSRRSSSTISRRSSRRAARSSRRSRSTSAPRRWARSSTSRSNEGDVVTQGPAAARRSTRATSRPRCRTARPAWRRRKSQLDQTQGADRELEGRAAARPRTRCGGRSEMCKAGLLPREHATSAPRTT